MAVNSNRYNPIASTGSNRYSPIPAVSDTEIIPVKPIVAPVVAPIKSTIPKTYQQGVMENGKFVLKTVTLNTQDTISQGDFKPTPVTGADIKKQQSDMEKVTGAGQVRIPFAKEKTFSVATPTPVNVGITNIAARTPELLVKLPVAALNFFRKNIKALVGSAMGQENVFEKPVMEKQFSSIFGLDPRRFGITDEDLQDTWSSAYGAYEKRNEANPPKNEFDKYKNASMAVATTIVPDVLDVLFGLDVTRGVLKNATVVARFSARQLPEGLLFKMTENNISPQAIKDVLLGTANASKAEIQIANNFIKKLTPAERAELFKLANSYEKIGLNIPIKGEAAPTVLGKFAGAEAPAAGLPPKISGLLPGGAPLKPSMQAGFINPGAMGDDLVKLAQQAKDIKEFKGALSKEAIASLTAKGFGVEAFYEAVKGGENAIQPQGDSPMDYTDDMYKSAQTNMPEVEIQPLEKVIQSDIRTPMSERVRFIDYVRTPWKVFERMGIRPQYQELLKGYENYVAELPKNIDKITAWSKQVPKESNERIFRSLDGEKIELAPIEAQVAGEIKTWLGEWADRLGMKPDSRISEYITHIFPFGKGGEIPEEIALLINKKIPGSVYNPFLLQRQGAEGYLKNTWKALDAYVKRATRKVHMDPALASLQMATDKMTDVSQLNFLNKYIGAINLRPTELDSLVDNQIKDKVGYLFGARPTATITRGIRQMIARAKIGGSITSFAKNLTQGVNTFAELGSFYTTKGYIDLVRFGGKELQENGVLVAPFIEDRTYSAVKKMAEKFDNVLFMNMTASELVNRGAAYYGAKAKFLKGKTTPKEYKQAFGKVMPTGYKPTLEDAITYGKFISGKTQFLFGPLDTPVGLNSDIAKTAAQFQTFGLKQTEFIASMIGNRNWWKLIRYIASSMLLFSYIGGQFGMKWDDSFKTLKFGMPPAVTFAMDMWGAVLGTKDQYGNVPSPSSRARKVGSSLFTNIVPGGAQIKRSVEGFSAVNQGVSRGNPSKANPQGAFQYEIDKTPMNYIRGTIFGKSNLPQAKDYYNKKSPAPSSSSRYNPI